jgi:hypothetical protein
MEEYERSFDEKVILLTKDLVDISVKYDFGPGESIFDYFRFKADNPVIYHEIIGEGDADAMKECLIAYYLYFPEGR